MKRNLTYLFVFLFVLILFSVFYLYYKPVKQDKKSTIYFGENSISILNFGDMIFDRGVRDIMEKYGRDPFQYIKKDLDILKKYDLIIANLEGPIVEMDRAKCQTKIYNFQFASSTPKMLESIGINIVNIANNHTYDCYNIGYISTKNYLDKSGISYIGDTEIDKSYIIKNINGKKIAILGIDRTISSTPISNFYNLIKKLKLENDYVVVHIHWGAEYELKENEEQRILAHSLIDNGVDVIIGHHPHVIEPVEIYKNKIIFYSLGNFVFDQSGENETNGIGVGVEFKNGSIKSTILPYKIKTFSPDLLKGDDRLLFCSEYLKNIKNTDCAFEIGQ